MRPSCVLASLAVLSAMSIPEPAAAQELGCMPHVAAAPGLVRPASFSLVRLAENEVGLRYVGHSTFLIESPKGVRIATDYNDHVRAPVTPDIATMNKAHSTHYSTHPEPGITHVLRGWTADGSKARHDVTLLDVHVRNVATNIRSGGEGTEDWGNSIFVFEVAGLCIAHLGHLHHTLAPWDLQQLGRIDVVLAPVDGSWTLDVEGMVEVLKAIQAPLIIPMHYFGEPTLRRFLDRAAQDFEVERTTSSSLVLSKEALPAKPKVLVLPPGG
jgi:L-ascorbate metabolism protein UlaG (beta-lactamase superfamily)